MGGRSQITASLPKGQDEPRKTERKSYFSLKLHCWTWTDGEGICENTTSFVNAPLSVLLDRGEWKIIVCNMGNPVCKYICISLEVGEFPHTESSREGCRTYAYLDIIRPKFTPCILHKTCEISKIFEEQAFILRQSFLTYPYDY